jgi:O-antigen/teichoic acid export membrane protein
VTLKRGSKRDLVLRGSANIGLRVFSVALLFGVSVILARVLGASGYGEYSYVFAIVTLLGIPVQLGIPVFLMRGVAQYEALKEWSLLRGLLRRSNQVVVVLSIVIGTVAALVYFGFFSSRLSAGVFVWGLVFMMFTSLIKLYDAGLTGFRRPLQASIPYAVVRPALVIGILLMLLFAFDKKVSPAEAMALQAGATIIALLVGAVLLLRVLPTELKGVKPNYRSAEWSRVLLPLSVLTGMQLLINQVDVVMLGNFMTTDKVGIYRAALRFSGLISTTSMVTLRVLAPYVARAYARDERVRLQHLVVFASRFTLVMTLPLVIIFLIASHWLLGAAYGQAFASGSGALEILTLGQFIGVLAGPAGMVVKMAKHEKTAAKVVGLAVIMNIVLNAVLIPQLGILGSATAAASSTVVINAVMAGLVFSKMNLWTLPFGAHAARKHL